MRSLTKVYPYLVLDAMYEKIRIDGRVVSQAVVVAYGISVNGFREVIGNDVVPSESLETWQTFLRKRKIVASTAFATCKRRARRPKAAIAAEQAGAT